MHLGIFVSHPIQYFAPVWRSLAATPGLTLSVYFFSDHSIRGGVDLGFGRSVKWDVPMIDGYSHRFIRRDADLSRTWSVALPEARRLLALENLHSVLVHGYTHRFEWQVVFAARSEGIRTVLRGELNDMQAASKQRFSPGSLVKETARNIALAAFYQSIDSFCYVGKLARQHLLVRGIPEERLFFSPYSVDDDLFEAQRAQIDRERAREDLGIHDSDFAVLFSGKLIPRKDPSIVLRALGILADPSLRLIVVGDGELRETLEAEARQLGISSQVIFAGFVNQSRLGKYFVAADAFVLPSTFETWGLVVNEAMQFALPVIVSDAVGCRHDLVEDGETGLVFPAGDEATLAERLRTLRSDRAEARRLGANARRRIGYYSVKNSVRGICEAIGLTARSDASPVGAAE